MANYRSPIERLFGDKGMMILVTVLAAVTMTATVTVFQLQKISAEIAEEQETALAVQKMLIVDIRDRLEVIREGGSQSIETDRALNDIRAQLDIIRRDSVRSQAELIRVADVLTKLIQSFEQQRVDLKLKEPE